MKIYLRVMRGGDPSAKKTFYDRMIAWYSRSPYTHVEFHWPLADPNPPQYLGANTDGGVQIRPANYIAGQPWDVFSMRLTQAQIAKLEGLLRSQIGKPYNFRAIVAMAFPFVGTGDPDAAFFCSDLAYQDTAEVGYPLQNAPERDADVMTPRDIAISPMLSFERRLPAL